MTFAAKDVFSQIRLLTNLRVYFRALLLELEKNLLKAGCFKIELFLTNWTAGIWYNIFFFGNGLSLKPIIWVKFKCIILIFSLGWKKKRIYKYYTLKFFPYELVEMRFRDLFRFEKFSIVFIIAKLQ